MTEKTKQDIGEAHALTAHECAALDAHIANLHEKPPTPGLKFEITNGVETIGIDHPSQKIGLSILMDAVGTTDLKFFEGLINQLVVIGSKNGKKDKDAINFLLAVVKGIEPKDQIEAMLAVQMAVVHMHAMNASEVLLHAESIPQQDSAERAFNKLMRTYPTQMEALRRYRNGGEQKVTVKHVTVNEGGQAIVGNLTTGGEG